MQEISDLADEIERRRLKFADMIPGHYEMLSDDEHELIVSLLRTAAEVAKNEADLNA
jgi:hypothetical protein